MMRRCIVVRALMLVLSSFMLVGLSSADESINEYNPNLDTREDDIDLEDMSDEELEEICTSRGFELVRELNATTGEPLIYTHQDYVDAASECLQIEADLEEILTSHPEILEDVKKESERMMRERDRLQQQLDQLQNENNGKDKTSEAASHWGLRGKGDNEIPNESNQQEEHSSRVADSTANEVMTPKKTEPIFNFKEITQEVIQQMKSDMTKLINIILPKTLRDLITPSLKTFVSVAKDMYISTYDLLKRHLKAFFDKGGGTTDTAENNKTPSQREVVQ